MGFKGYKLKHKLIVLQSIQDQADPASVYAKTFEITLFISAIRTNLVRFDEIESVIASTLGKYSEKNLDQIKPFDELEPSLENMGNVFYQLIKQNLARIDMSLEKLEISESPIMTYIVNETNTSERFFVGDKKIKISSLIVGNIISQSVTHLISEFEKPEQAAIPVEQAPQPIEEEEAPAEKTAPPPSVIQISPALSEERAPLYKFALGVLFLTISGILASLYLKSTGAYPAGADIYGHLFKSDLLYNSIKNGDLYPLYTSLWYNGMQPFRYWAPLPYYLLAVFQFFAGGDAIASYLIFVAFSFAAGGIGWLLWGLTYNRMAFCTFLGCLWFLLPDNMRVFFVEGNFPRMTIAIFLPYLFYFLWMFVEHRKKWSVIPAVILMCFITLCHAMIAAMTGITAFIFLLIYSAGQKRVKESFCIIYAMLLSFALCGLWLYPALKGGLLGMEASATLAVMKSLSTPVLVSLNPFLRTEGIFLYFYYGLSIFGLSVAGLFLANKKSRPGFYTVVIIFFGTTTAMVPFLDKLPMNQLFWMTRFTPIAYAVFLLALLEWKKCRRYAVIMIALILVIDCIPSMRLFSYHSQTPSKISFTLADAKALTRQRISLLDLSGLGSYPSFNISSTEPLIPYTFGWAWQGAATSHNIVMINTAAEKGYYYYLFDRSLELGDDTVMVYKELVGKANQSPASLNEAADALGYKFYKETNDTYIYHRDGPSSFGVMTHYQGLAIGRSAQQITLEYPVFEEGKSQNLSDYSLKELRKYKVIYLSDFTYDNKEEAQDLLTRAADSGVKVIIDMNRIPIDPITSRMTFFDVTAQSVTFTHRYPELMYKNKIYEALPFQEGYSTWNTVYLENLNNIMGYSWFQNKKLPFIGTAGNKNIIFIGYNFLYHSMETNDTAILSLMGDLLGFEPEELPDRKVVPITVNYGDNKILIDTPGGEINTTLAYQDNFRSEQKIFNKNNLLTVVQPHTEIEISYPYLFQGLAVSAAGLVGIIWLIYFINRKRGRSNEETPI